MRYEVPEFILAVAPLMRELLSLREEVHRLRMLKDPAPAELLEAMDATPFRLERQNDAKWGFSIGFLHFPTGGAGYETAQEAFRGMLNHVATVWIEREREFYETDEDEDEDST